MKKWWTTLAVTVTAIAITACSGGSDPFADEKRSSGYPERPLTIVAPSGAGGGWDTTARSITKALGTEKLVDQTITVENKPGGGGAVFMAEYATKYQKDPYRLFVSSPPILLNNLKKEGNSPYGYKDTTPLAQLTKDYGVVAVRKDSKYKDLKSLIQDLKKNPKSATLAGGSAPGSMDHVVAVLPAYESRLDPKKLKYVSYDGGGEAIAALLGGNADVIATDVSSIGEYKKAGKVRILGVTSPERLRGDLKDIPTLKEQGIDAEFTIWRGIFGPKEMSPEAKKYWEDTLRKLSETKAWQKELDVNDWEGEYKNSEKFTAFLKKQEKQVTEILTKMGMAK